MPATRYDAAVSEYRRRAAFARNSKEYHKALRCLRLATKIQKVAQRGATD